MTKKQTETLVGGFVLLGILAIVFLALKAANLVSFSFDATYALQARFDNVGGLKANAPVKSAGVTVGRIASITFDNKSFRGLVTMNIDRRYQFPADSSVKILTAGILGDNYIGIDPGGDDKNLQAGDTITLTQSAVVLEDLIGKLLFSKAAEAPAPKTGAEPK
jgi:phospholipid/cholesterol/gamma-HCH transport system substrate-binding protein